MNDSIISDSGNGALTGEFKIIVDGKRTVKSSCSGQVIEALKRASEPLPLAKITSRVRQTKAGKALKVKDVKARCLKTLKWYVDNSDWVQKDDEGNYSLTRV